MEFATSIAVYWATTVLGKEPYSRCLVAVAPNGIKGRMTSLVLTYDLRLMILVCYPSLMVNITLNMLFFFFFLMTYGYWKQQHLLNARKTPQAKHGETKIGSTAC